MTKGKGEGSKKKAKVNKIMLPCSICKGRDHGWCYGVFIRKSGSFSIRSNPNSYHPRINIFNMKEGGGGVCHTPPPSMKAGFIHICGRCEIQNDTVRTSEEIKSWYLTNFKSEADKEESLLLLC